MAKTEPESTPTPEEIAAMEEKVRAYRAQQAQEAAAAQREAAKPLIDLVNSDALKAVSDAVPSIEALAADAEKFPYLRDHIGAIRNGIFGLRQLVGMIPAEQPPADATAPAPAPAEA